MNKPARIFKIDYTDLGLSDLEDIIIKTQDLSILGLIRMMNIGGWKHTKTKRHEYINYHELFFSKNNKKVMLLFKENLGIYKQEIEVCFSEFWVNE